MMKKIILLIFLVAIMGMFVNAHGDEVDDHIELTEQEIPENNYTLYYVLGSLIFLIGIGAHIIIKRKR